MTLKNDDAMKLALGIISAVAALSGVSLAILGAAFVSTRLLLAAAGSAFIAAVTAIWTARMGSAQMSDALDLRALEARLKFGDRLDAAECEALLTFLRAAIECLKHAPVPSGYSWNDERRAVLDRVRESPPVTQK